METTTKVTVPNTFTRLIDLVKAARVTDSQIPLVFTSARTIRFYMEKANVGRIYFINDPTTTAEGESFLAETTKEDKGTIGNQKSLLDWYVKSDNGTEIMDVLMEY